VTSPAGVAAVQLSKQGRLVRAGQNVDFVRVKGKPNSISWYLIDEHPQVDMDTTWYCDQLLRAADEVLCPFGVPKRVLSAWLNDQGSYWTAVDYVNETRIPLPMLEAIIPDGKVCEPLSHNK
jgi:DNA polymerase elongation subunit (family B)